MRPRLIGRGNFLAFMAIIAQYPGFNEAPTYRSGKSTQSPGAHPRSQQASMRPRLIGRGNFLDDGGGMAVVGASMRPRLIGRGNEYQPPYKWHRLLGLQ